jgi:nitrite reductase/ring-hydroxylating ferredoxin subunit
VSTFVKVALSAEIPPGTCRMVEVDGHKLALFNVGGQFHAADNACPHFGGPLAEGSFSGTQVTCPWHSWTFDVVTGENVHAPQLKLSTYPVKVDGPDVLVDVSAIR